MMIGRQLQVADTVLEVLTRRREFLYFLFTIFGYHIVQLILKC